MLPQLLPIHGALEIVPRERCKPNLDPTTSLPLMQSDNQLVYLETMLISI